MKKNYLLLPVLVASSTLSVLADDVPLDKPSDKSLDKFMDRLTFSGRFGLNINAKFGPRTAPGGGAYNYLDGYVHNDSTGNFDPTGTFPDGITQNWGYDNSSRQVNAQNNTILMTRGGGSNGSMNDDPQLGAELGYTRELFSHGDFSFGFETALNYMNVSFNDGIGYSGSGTQDAYPYFTGTIPPAAPNANGQPYQGQSSPGQQGGFVIGATPVSSTPVAISMTGRHQFDADLWGFRLGPYIQYSLGKHVDLNLVGGFTAVLIHGEASWSETLTVNGVTDSPHSGSGNNDEVLVGYYVGANVAWHLSRRLDLTGGVQFQDVGTYSMALGSRQVELDLSESVFVTVGLNFKF